MKFLMLLTLVVGIYLIYRYRPLSTKKRCVSCDHILPSSAKVCHRCHTREFKKY